MRYLDSVGADARKKSYEQSIRAAFAENRSDTRARATIQAFCHDGEPFVLFLRSFEQEAHDVPKPATEIDPKRRLFSYMGGVSGVENKLAKGLGDKVRVVGIANPSDLIVTVTPFPRLELFDRPWLDVAEWLVQASAFIVVDVDVLAPGVLAELDAIAKHHREQATVVVLPAQQEPRPSATLAEQELLRNMGGQLPAHEQPDSAHPRLAMMPRVIYEDEIPGDLRSSPLFADLLAAYEQQQRREAEPDAEALARRARLAKDWGLLQLAAGELAEAMDTFAAAVPLFSSTNDPLGQADVLVNIGKTYIEAGQYEDAAETFRISGVMSKKYGDEAGFWSAATWIAIAYFLAGDLKGSAAYLLPYLDEIRAAGETELLAQALDVLCRTYRATGDKKSARRCEEDLRAAQADARR
jgi:tetratricopeptide (TPR) repeat protein